ncbi:MAG: DUF3352 domain-containing protein [Planctomycetota bacterium]|jgi:hypothetical protein|nr:DUF3352 domain-containing protein [Planctomycetota bacterium]
MSADSDYLNDDDDDYAEEGSEPGEAVGADRPGEPAAKVPLRNWLAGKRGWLILITLTLSQALFASVMIALRSRAAPSAATREELVRGLAVDMLGREVRIERIHQVVRVPGGKNLVIFMDIALVLGQLPEERIEGAERPGPEEMEIFAAAVAELAPAIRSRVNAMVRRLPPEQFATAEARRAIAEEVGNFVNDTLAGLNFGDRIRPGLGRRRVTEVLLPAFIRQLI